MKTNVKFQQRSKVGVAGSFINQMMANNASIPEVGKGATLLLYTDRTCYEVIEVSEDKQTVKLEELDAEADHSMPLEVGHQNWILKPTGRYITVQWRGKQWKRVTEKITFTKAWKDAHPQYASIARSLTEAQREEIYQGTPFPSKVVKGITRLKKEYTPVKLIFGRKDYYYDWSF